MRASSRMPSLTLSRTQQSSQVSRRHIQKIERNEGIRLGHECTRGSCRRDTGTSRQRFEAILSRVTESNGSGITNEPRLSSACPNPPRRPRRGSFFCTSTRAVLSSPVEVEGEDMPEQSIDLPQGTLDLLILRTLNLGPNHGWAISERIHQVSSKVLQVQQGSL